MIQMTISAVIWSTMSGICIVIIIPEITRKATSISAKCWIGCSEKVPLKMTTGRSTTIP
jgi:hypothetical protein